ncbi:protein MARD1-like isoform X1 [Cucurbita moschata]|uniref:Protein MARD1-like isoform X1 n=2 Tax=Cucurbita moschata TaxID=3662 RepID=A0A6J1H4Q7_CUCMO|nr:protein MARD1-like isoform X1 [Cucurbita moschata]
MGSCFFFFFLTGFRVVISGELDLEVELAMGGGGGGGGDGGGGCLPSPMSNNRKLSSSFLFRSSSSKGFSETEAVMSPTSILEPFMGLRSSFWSESNSPRTSVTESKRPWDSKGIGLGIVDALTEENSDQKPTKSDTRMVLLGSQLKIQIPPLPQFVSPTDESPRSLAEFGIKTRNPHLGSLSPVSSLSPAKKSSISGHETPTSPLVFTGCLSADEIEQSEDYTCVISHGPNPRTTHIFGDCVIESGAGVYSPARKENGYFRDRTSFSSENFLSFCYNCKKKLEEGKDIYIYRGDKAFCSHECRYHEMMLEEEGGD